MILNISATKGLLAPFLLLFIFGLIFGSFLNSLIYRLAHGISIWGYSACPHCQKKLLYRDLIPLISFLALRGKCRFCGKKIGWQYFLVELFTGILFVLIFWQHQVIDLFLIRNLFFVLVLTFIFIFDLKYYLILDKIIWPSLLIAFLINLFLGFGIWNLILGILIGAGFFLVQYLVSKAKWVGLGDVKFGALLGAMFGFNLTILTIILAYIIGGFIAIILLLSSKKRFGEVLPMGAFLSVAGFIVLLWGQQILDYYFNLLGF